MESYLMVAVFFALALALPIAALTLGKFLRPHQPTVEKGLSYESGVDPIGDSWIQFNARYYLYALLFVIFDVGAVFLYPWAVSYNVLHSEMGLLILASAAIFILFLVVGLVYAWKNKVLEWK